MAHVRIALNIDGRDDFRTDAGVEDLRERLYTRLAELMAEKTLAFEKFYNGEELPKFKLCSLNDAEEAVKDLRFSLLFDQDLGEELPPISENHFTLALNALDAAAHHLRLSVQFEKVESAIQRFNVISKQAEEALERSAMLVGPTGEAA